MKNLLLKTILISIFLCLAVLIIPKITPVFASSLILNPPFGNINAGKNLSIDVVLKGNDEIVDGVDASISYDVNFLKVKEIKTGNFFNNYPVKKDNSGKITITALAPKDGVKIIGNIVVATITFEVLDSGQTDVIINYQKDATIDSNVPVHGTAVDSLTEVKSGSYTVTATPENIQLAKAKKFKGSVPLWPFFIIILLIIAGGVWYYLKHRKPPREDVFIPEEFPLDRPPKLE